MIILNQILQETVLHIRNINKLKCDFWAKVTHTGEQNALDNLFTLISEKSPKRILEKKHLETFLGLNSVRGKFVDSFFYGNSANENYMVYIDFHQYMMKYIKISEVLTKEIEELSIEECFKNILRAEQSLFELLEPKKRSLIATFDYPTELFSFLKILFEDISTFSARNQMKIMDFQKANTKLRLNHNFPLLSASDTSYLQNYFHLNCDNGISYEEFIFMFCDYVSLQTNLQSNLHNSINEVMKESFLPVNIIPASMRFNINNFKEQDGLIEQKAVGLKALLLKGITGNQHESDAVYVNREKSINEVQAQNPNISHNSYMEPNRSVQSRILDNSQLNISLNNKKQNEVKVQGVVETIQNQSMKQLSKHSQSKNQLSVNQSGMNPSMLNNSAIRNLSQMSYPQVNIYQHAPDFEANSFMIPIEESKALINEPSSIIQRPNIQTSVLDDESDHLSQLDQTIRENILEFRY